MDGWLRDGMETRCTLTLTPPLCSMLLDPFLQDRYVRHLNGLIELAQLETSGRNGSRRIGHWLKCISAVSPRFATPISDTNAISSARFENFRTAAGSKSSPAPPRTRWSRCSPIIRRPSAHKF